MLSQVPPLGFKGVFFSAPCAALITGLLCLIAAKGRKCVQEVILIPPLYPLLPHNSPSFAPPYSIPLLCSPTPFSFFNELWNFTQTTNSKIVINKGWTRRGLWNVKAWGVWPVIYEKTLPLDLGACDKCHHSSFVGGRRIRWKINPACSLLLVARWARSLRIIISVKAGHSSLNGHKFAASIFQS